jgi:hypothetical protein
MLMGLKAHKAGHDPHKASECNIAIMQLCDASQQESFLLYPRNKQKLHVQRAECHTCWWVSGTQGSPSIA